MMRVSAASVVRKAVCVAGLLLPLNAAAQSVGVKGGVAVSQVVFTNGFADTTPMAPALVGGATVGFRLPWKLGLQVEGLVSEYRPTVNEIQDDRLRYLEVPVLLRYRVPGTPTARPIHVSGGAVVRRLLAASEVLAGESFDIKDGVADNDLALAIGGDVELFAKWTIDVRYVHGRDGIYRRFGGGYAGRHRTVQITLGYAVKR
jgi:hypothetical protein